MEKYNKTLILKYMYCIPVGPVLLQSDDGGGISTGTERDNFLVTLAKTPHLRKLKFVVIVSITASLLTVAHIHCQDVTMGLD